MNRKHFIGGLGAVATGLLLPSFKNSIQQTGTSTFNKPPYLNAGDVIGITAPAGFITLAEVQPAIQVLESWGYKVRVGTTIGKKDNTFGGTDQERASDFQGMLDERNVKAIMCARGGYGVVRIIDQLNWI